jgi:hypothetical protein
VRVNGEELLLMSGELRRGTLQGYEYGVLLGAEADDGASLLYGFEGIFDLVEAALRRDDGSV